MLWWAVCIMCDAGIVLQAQGWRSVTELYLLAFFCFFNFKPEFHKAVFPRQASSSLCSQARPYAYNPPASVPGVAVIAGLYIPYSPLTECGNLEQVIRV